MRPSLSAICRTRSCRLLYFLQLTSGATLLQPANGENNRQQQQPESDSSHWLADTVWDWNGWAEVQFLSDGVFSAPDGACARGGCRWHSLGDREVVVDWAEAGEHVLSAAAQEHGPPTASRGATLRGKRRSDGDPCVATFVRTLAQTLRQDPEDLYSVLGVQRDASEKEIKKAYRSQSLKFHPDKNRDDPVAAEARFIEVANSYEILIDPQKRAAYDRGGQAALEQAEQRQHTARSAEAAFRSFNDLFAALFAERAEPEPDGEWATVGVGCCANLMEENLLSETVGGLSACQRRCEAMSNTCSFAVHGWAHAPHWCTLMRQCTKPLLVGSTDCGSRGDNGVRTYRLAHKHDKGEL